MEKYKQNLIVFVGFTSVVVAILAIFASTILEHTDLTDPPNLSTLIIEIGVGVIIAIIVYSISRKSEKSIENKITDMLGIVKTNEKIKTERKNQAYSSLLSMFQEIQDEITRIMEESKKYTVSKDPIQKRAYKDQITLRCKKIKNLAERNLDDSAKVSSEFFDLDTLEILKDISGVCKIQPKFDDEKNLADVSFCHNLKTMIEPRISELKEKIETSVKKITPYEHPKLEANVEKFSIATSADRTVYPLGSTIYVRANLESFPEEEIIFQVFNSNRKLLLSQHVDPSKPEHPDLAKGNIFQASFKMEGSEWKVGKTYIVRATCGGSFSEDSFVIDERAPIVQTDRSVYMINSDMILTVIDPDADRDNDVAEIIGDQENFKVTIESKYGKIDGYKLRETGDSTGIFQGIVGILGVRQNGTIIPRNLDGKIIDKIQGTGIDDGFIGGSPGDEIVISYKNSTSVAYMKVYVSNFGATVEMDKKVYKPNDKVYLTVVAPDCNFDSNSVDSIGDSPESIIEIKTRNDKILKYKLIETGTDTGIFTGEFLLQLNNKSQETKTNLGPTNGVISCDKDDSVEVRFNLFGEEVLGRALIKP